MNKSLINQVKKKKEFSQLPDSVVERALEKVSSEENLEVAHPKLANTRPTLNLDVLHRKSSKFSNEDVKAARALLRKYFGVFLTNKILKGNLNPEEVLEKHLSSKKRDYDLLYRKIFEVVGDVKCVVDLGSGVNGFSYKFMIPYVGEVDYVGIEAVGQIVKRTISYLRDRGFEKAHVLQGDLFNLDFVLDILKKLENEKPRVIFLFQVIDALESLEKDFSKKFLLELTRESEFIVLSVSLKSLSGKKGFESQRKWLFDFIEKEFEVFDSFEMFDEKFIVFGKK